MAESLKALQLTESRRHLIFQCEKATVLQAQLGQPTKKFSQGI